MSTGRRIPHPVRRDPLLPAGLTLTGYLLATVVVGVFGGGAVSAMICGHGLGIVAPARMSATLVRLAMRPGDPAAAWVGAARPGPAWLTWLCIGLVAGLWCIMTAIADSEIGARLRHRHRDGLAGTAELGHLGLDEPSATRKAAQEYPRLAHQRPGRHSTFLRRVRR
ncbi:hypothetical protein ACIP5Y_07390 [Nocardia sp. NPDC088792]|uniref:hypothetical protein n=1 Tax=Nocardia sp. NPDC088792 TaxID=3364332 RepID=UPI003823FC13